MTGATSVHPTSLRYLTHAFIVTVVIAAGITAGCGSNGSSMTTPQLVGNTNVTVMVTSTANDQVTNFNLQLKTLELTSQPGKTVTLLSSPQSSEFVHVNGGTEPLMTVSVPQDIYTSAAVTLGQAEFVCVSQDPNGGLMFSHYSGVDHSPLVNFASPITVTGSSMVLSLNLQVSSSAVFPSCYSPGFAGYSMSPTFSLTPLMVSPSPANARPRSLRWEQQVRI